MKRKGFSKLILAGVGLAATAATLTTATYAWYVSNSTVSATGVTGKVNSTQSGALYIALNNETGGLNKPQQYKTSITLTGATKNAEGAFTAEAADKTAGKFFAQDLEPQSLYTGDTTYTYAASEDATAVAGKEYFSRTGTGVGDDHYVYTKETVTVGTTDVSNFYVGTPVLVKNKTWLDSTGKKEVTAKFISFKYWLKSSSNGTVAFKLTVDNVTSSGAGLTQQAFAPDGLPTGVAQGGAFIADAVHALRMNVVQTEYETLTSHAKDTYTEITDQSSSKTYVAGTTYYKELDTPIYEATTDSHIQQGKTYYTDATGATAVEVGDNKTYKVGDRISTTWYEKVEYAVATAADIRTANSMAEDAEITSTTSVVGFYTRTQGAANAVYVAKDGATSNDYQVDKIALGVTGANYVTNGSTAATRDTNKIAFVEGGDANVYYHSVLGEAAYKTAGYGASDQASATGASTDATTGAATWATMSLKANVDTLFEFKIWLEGSDADCWDSCKGQEFSFDFDIDYTETPANTNSNQNPGSGE